jgi:hypothetical protein
MLEAYLSRFMTTKDETFGLFMVNDYHLTSLELPWRQNKRDISCIPHGIYLCKRHESKDNAFRVLDVPGRSGILIEIGNHYHESKGCIFIGTGFMSNISDGKTTGIASSTPALTLLDAVLGDEDCFHLTVRSLQ